MLNYKLPIIPVDENVDVEIDEYFARYKFHPKSVKMIRADQIPIEEIRQAVFTSNLCKKNRDKITKFLAMVE